MALVSDEDDLSPLFLLPDPDPQPEEWIELHERRTLLLQAIETLPSHHRMVVLLRYATQRSFREIGHDLGISEATAKTHFFRAKKTLRTLLEPEFAHERGMERQ